MDKAKDIIKKILPHLVPFLIYFIIVSIYFFPLYEGKTLVQSDNVQLAGTLSELNEYRDMGEEIHWSNVQFSGMPLQNGSLKNHFSINKSIFFWLPQPVVIMLWLYLGFYILMITLGVNNWLSGIAALAFAFSSFNIISIEVGHDNKVYAIAFMAPVLAGAILAYSRKYLQSLLLTTVLLGFHIYYYHIQISYYLLIMLIVYAIIMAWDLVKAGQFNTFIKGSVILLIAAFLAVGGNIPRLWKVYEYGQASNRGGSELTSSSVDSNRSSSSGLDIDYALNWSNGVAEIFTIMIPYFHGGASGEELEDDSKMAQVLRTNGMGENQINSVLSRVPLYWGDQPFTQGAIYFGILIVGLFAVSLFVLDRKLLVWGLVLVVISLLLSMGKNALWFSELFFYNVPLYNKFRSVTMIIAIPQLIFPMFGFMALDKIVSGGLKAGDIKKILMRSLIIVSGLLLFWLIFKKAFFDFEGAHDGSYGYPGWLLNALIDDRISLFNADIFRGLALLAAVSVAFWFWFVGKLSRSQFYIVFLILIIIDLLPVDRRYLGHDDFVVNRSSAMQQIPITPADQTILQDESYYRVFNTTRNITGDGLTSYHHFSVGGYSAIKLQRYQEVIEGYISKGHRGVLSMLNSKYFIVNGSENQPQAQRNNQALGNAWLVKSITEVNDANEEFNALESVNIGDEAVYDKRFSGYLQGTNGSFAGSGRIGLMDYHPEVLKYQFESSNDEFAVFSEIYYQPGWQAYLDGEEVEHIRVNYLLRGLKIPAGNHEIVFEYDPPSIKFGIPIQTGSFILIAIMILATTIFTLRSKNSLTDKD